VDKVEYEVTRARQINGAWRAVGDRVFMAPAAAKYHLPPYGEGLKLPDPAGTEPAAAGPVDGEPVSPDGAVEGQPKAKRGRKVRA
jgi:hypothetical protein